MATPIANQRPHHEDCADTSKTQASPMREKTQHVMIDTEDVERVKQTARNYTQWKTTAQSARKAEPD